MVEIRRPSNADVFEPTKLKLRSILEEIDAGALKLLDFQRDWVWDDKGVVKLIVSIAMGHPIGAVMFLETGGEVEFGSRAVAGTGDRANENLSPSQLILDGQQRLTSSYNALLSSTAIPLNSKRGVTYRRYFIDIRKMLSGDIPAKEAIISVATNALGRPNAVKERCYVDPDYQYENLVFPLNMVFQFSEWESGFENFRADAIDDGSNWRERAAMVREFRNLTVKAFENCEVPIIKLRKGIGLDSVCSIYENLNNSGTPLSPFDLMIARFAAEGGSLREDWFGVKGDAGEEVVGIAEQVAKSSGGFLEKIEPQHFMNGVLLLIAIRKAQPIFRFHTSKMIEMKYADYLEHRDQMLSGFFAVGRFLREIGMTKENEFPYYLLVSLAVILASSPCQGDFREHRQNVEKWFWNSFYTNSHQNRARAIFTEVPQVISWLSGCGEQPVCFSDDVMDASLLKAKRKSPISMAINNRAVSYGIFDPVSRGQVEFDICRPEALFSKPELREMDTEVGQFENLVNSVLLPNTMPSPKEFGSASSWLQNVETKFGAEGVNRLLDDQGISADAVRQLNWPEFEGQRREFISAVVGGKIGRSVLAKGSEGSTNDDESWPDEALCRCVHRGAVVYATVRAGNIVVLEGSIMSQTETNSLPDNYRQTRSEWLNNGVVVPAPDGRSVLVRDLVVSSPSAASVPFSGVVVNNSVWKARDNQIFDWNSYKYAV